MRGRGEALRRSIGSLHAAMVGALIVLFSPSLFLHITRLLPGYMCRRFCVCFEPCLKNVISAQKNETYWSEFGPYSSDRSTILLLYQPTV